LPDFDTLRAFEPESLVYKGVFPFVIVLGVAGVAEFLYKSVKGKTTGVCGNDVRISFQCGFPDVCDGVEDVLAMAWRNRRHRGKFGSKNAMDGVGHNGTNEKKACARVGIFDNAR
jgi:hypothetical protein